MAELMQDDASRTIVAAGGGRKAGIARAAVFGAVAHGNDRVDSRCQIGVLLGLGLVQAQQAFDAVAPEVHVQCGVAVDALGGVVVHTGLIRDHLDQPYVDGAAVLAPRVGGGDRVPHRFRVLVQGTHLRGGVAVPDDDQIEARIAMDRCSGSPPPTPTRPRPRSSSGWKSVLWQHLWADASA
jgi:hypothetical protein